MITTSDYPLPLDSPWGEITEIDEIAGGFYKVETAQHTGLMVVPREAEIYLSRAARVFGFEECGFLCFSGDERMAAVYFELMRDESWEPPDCFIGTREHFDESLRATLMFENPEYLERLKRETGEDFETRAELEQIAIGWGQSAGDIIYPAFSVQ